MQSAEKIIHSPNLHAGTNFPYTMLDVRDAESRPKNAGFLAMHRHEDLQFILVLEGRIQVRMLTGILEAAAGEGVFINKNVIHLVTRLEPCHYNSFLFPEKFLAFYPESPAVHAVTRIIEATGLPVFLFSEDGGWQSGILKYLRVLSETGNERSETSALRILLTLCEIFFSFVRHVPVLPPNRKSLTEERMQLFLLYIQNHYNETITLETLARAANVSKSECLRCFKASMQITPYRYLLEYRLFKAAEYLRTTTEPVGAIATATGFHQASHFGKCFREKTKCTPGEYRKHYQQEMG